ncbi:hypothetical protein CVT24_012206 [Panaeolus cyanescens]|uniref:Uncharacterized protein n=1 Tax=Panaeolus cyanescens TaxID=181874 RepID=A0A409WX95_9AGAR|nr:hypothetical protein CVT24_012206 [Panaeolus cyanescens]
MNLLALASLYLSSLVIFPSSAFAKPVPNLIGNQLGVINLASQNSAVNNGNIGGSVSHSENTQNSAQQIVTDAQAVDVLKNTDVQGHALILL